MGRGVRAFVAVFLTAFVAVGLLRVEVWPFSGWELFSRVRTGEVQGWLATAVGANGVERPIPFGSFAADHRGELQVLKGFARLSPGERQDVCRAWAAEMGRVGAGTAIEIRVYAATDSTRRPRHPSELRRDLRYVCPAP